MELTKELEDLVDALHEQCIKRAPFSLTKEESDGVWYTLCGVLMRDGYNAAKAYADTVPFRRT